ncbi:MAG: hypothetical protein AAF917_11765 [Pseudomonadota bacterium]
MKHKIVNEIALFAAFLFAGFLILPFAVYLVGSVVFGDYSGGYGEFFGRLSGGLVSGHWPTWFLVLSPYLLLQIVRLSLFGLRSTR